MSDATNEVVPREALMWAYALSKDSDSIVGLHVCDDYKEFERRACALAIESRDTKPCCYACRERYDYDLAVSLDTRTWSLFCTPECEQTFYSCGKGN